MTGAGRSVRRALLSRPLVYAFASALLMSFPLSGAGSQGILDPSWGAQAPRCTGARSPVPYRASNPGAGNIEVAGIITCIDDGEALIYNVDYMNFELSQASKWQSAHLEWLGAGAQRAGAADRSDWIYDEVKPIRIEVKAGGKRASVTNLSFRVPKVVLADARGFGFYVVGGGIFWSIFLYDQLTAQEYQSPPYSKTVSVDPLQPRPGTAPSAEKRIRPLTDLQAASERSDWGASFTTCPGATTPIPLKAAVPENDNILANGIIRCSDEGDDFVYAIEYVNFSLLPTSKWTSVGLDWFGAGAQREGIGGRNAWTYDEVRPIKAEIGAGVKRVSVTDISFRVPKAALANARGFGFYVVGRGTLWSLLLL
jgi:hypothetical protein